MLVVDSANGPFEVKYSFYTLYLYEQEFGSDLIKDLYGNAMVASDDEGMSFDFSAINWTAVVKALWAGAKCANPKLPRFSEWADTGSDGIDLFDAAGRVINEVNKELFRFGVAAVS